MKLLVAGYSQEETNRLSAALRAAGHQVLGASGRHGARTFVKVVTPDLLLLPAGPQAAEVRGWVADLAPGLGWIAMASGDDPVAALAGGVPRSGPPTGEGAGDSRAAGASPRDRDVEGATTATTTIDVEASAWEAPPRVARPELERPAPSAPEPSPPRREASPHSATRAPFEPAARRDADAHAVPPPLPPPAPPRLPEHGRSALDPADRGAAESAPQDADLASKLAQTRFGDYHSILELEPDASPYAVREQYTRLSRLYSPRGWPRKLGPEDLETLQEVQSGIRDAYLILGEPELRARYERALLGTTTSPSTSRRR